MTISVSDDYGKLCAAAARDIYALMAERPAPLLCTASGDTPTGLYKLMVSEGVPVSWKFVGLDEWVGMNAIDAGSCRQYTDEHLFVPAGIAPGRIHFFDGRSADLEAECIATENYITACGGIDVAILGVGMNGHVGLNEPGVSPALKAHVMSIHPVTQKTGQKYFSDHRELKSGITLGIASLMEARHLILMASGLHKSSIMRQVIDGVVDPNVPASLLRQHPDLRVYLDKDAASLHSQL